MCVRRLHCPCMHHIRVLLLRPRRGRTRLYNTLKISLISYHSCKQWHTHHDGLTQSTRYRKNLRIFHMTCAKRHQYHRCRSLIETRPYHKDRCRATKSSHEGWIHAHGHTPSCQLRVLYNRDRSSRRCSKQQILEWCLINCNIFPLNGKHTTWNREEAMSCILYIQFLPSKRL